MNELITANLLNNMRHTHTSTSMKLAILSELDKIMDGEGLARNLLQKLLVSNHQIFLFVSRYVNVGILHDKTVDGSFTAAEFREFIQQLIPIIQHNQQKNLIQKPLLIFDNCKIHSAAKIDDICDCNAEIEYKFLPAYSPNLNPIENVFGFTHVSKHDTEQ